MGKRRMFTSEITDGDVFTALPPSSQALYFHLCISADDDGFSNQIRQSLFKAHATTDDFNLLVAKRFVLPFDSGVVVIKHWRMHNVIRNDRYHETKYLEEKSTLVLKENGVYTENDGSGIPVDNQLTTNGIPTDNQVTPEVKLSKDKLSKDNIKARFVRPSVDEVRAYCTERGNSVDPQQFVDFYESKGWKVGNQSMKDWKAAVRTWEKRDRAKDKPKPKPNRFNNFEQRSYDFDELERKLLGR